MIKACVIGWPISHSRSPLIHGYWLRQFGIDGSYERIPVKPDSLAAFLRDLGRNGYAGCNVTIPHKEEAFRCVEAADEHTRRLQAVNTVFFREGRLLGTNTDGEGFIRNLRSQVPEVSLRAEKAVVLGAGGAAASIVSALLEEEVAEICIVNRSPERSLALQERFGSRLKAMGWEQRSDVLDGARLLVNTTSLGMTGQPPLEIDLRRLGNGAVVSDIVYSPLQTALLTQARAMGLRTVEGLGMLLHQAVRGFELWFGVKPEVTSELYRLIARDIDPGFAA